MKFTLGNRLRDRVSGVEGITTAYVVFMNGCVQWNIHPKADKDGKLIESNYYDEQQLEYVDDGIAKLDNKKAVTRATAGGANSRIKSVM